MTPLELPPDLVHVILPFLTMDTGASLSTDAESRRGADLAAAARISRAWARPAQAHLQRTLSFWHDAHVRRFISSRSVDSTFPTRSVRLLGDLSTADGVKGRSAAQLFELLTGVQRLDLAGLYRFDVSALSSPTLSGLKELSHTIYEDSPDAIIRLPFSLTSLDIRLMSPSSLVERSLLLALLQASQTTLRHLSFLSHPGSSQPFYRELSRLISRDIAPELLSIAIACTVEDLDTTQNYFVPIFALCARLHSFTDLYYRRSSNFIYLRSVLAQLPNPTLRRLEITLASDGLEAYIDEILLLPSLRSLETLRLRCNYERLRSVSGDVWLATWRARGLVVVEG